MAAPLVLMALAAALSRRPRKGGAVSVCVPCFGRVARALGLILVTITLSLAWPSLAQHSRLVRLPRSPSRVGLYGCLGLATPALCLLVSFRPLANECSPSFLGSAFKRSPARWDACRSIANAAMAKKTKAKAPAKKPTAAKPKATSKSSSGGGVVSVEACKS